MPYLRQLTELCVVLTWVTAYQAASWANSTKIPETTSPWASPIVIVLKKNGVDIRLCIDYRKVNAITMIMEYAMPLVDDILSELEKYLWFCSCGQRLLGCDDDQPSSAHLGASRRISAFVCALGHFECLRMPFGLKNVSREENDGQDMRKVIVDPVKGPDHRFQQFLQTHFATNAPMIYQRMIDKALWGYVQPKDGWSVFARRIGRAEEVATTQRQSQGGDPTQSPCSLTKFATDNCGEMVLRNRKIAGVLLYTLPELPTNGGGTPIFREVT
ncbi:LOW QUALITY PROTEIN: Reverse transcriptase [Phytophthora palmivora]|uniref:Reverse transcriptase n=1 Tax=Phytophthora palmivora TaxID=4796 RepID=A0A2P4YEK2_9STRA|nr:LOW QUALITY PROTEIN: Reverse transcriptase [Phytophthora palmivora]